MAEPSTVATRETDSEAEADEALPRVAVLMSTFNGGRFVGEQLDSLAAQRGVVCDVFVRDDGSTDDTLEVLRRYAERWPQLAAPFSGPNLGPAMSFLELLKRAPEDYDYYAFCDQDDVWLPEKLARAVQFIRERSGVTGPEQPPVLYCSQVTCADSDMTVIGEPERNGDARFEHILFENIAFGITVVMNAALRTIVTRSSPATGVAMHDWWCALVASAFGSVVYDPEPLVLYRQHRNNVVGARTNRAEEVLRQLQVILKDRSSYYPIHAQASEFLRLFSGSLPTERRMLVERLVGSKRTLGARIAYGLSEKFVRNRNTLAVRALVIAGLY